MATQIPMHDQHGQPWIAESGAEAFELSCQGYTRDKVETDDDKADKPPARPAQAPRPTLATAPSGDSTSS